MDLLQYLAFLSIIRITPLIKQRGGLKNKEKKYREKYYKRQDREKQEVPVQSGQKQSPPRLERHQNQWSYVEAPSGNQLQIFSPPGASNACFQIGLYALLGQSNPRTNFTEQVRDFQDIENATLPAFVEWIQNRNNLDREAAVKYAAEECYTRRTGTGIDLARYICHIYNLDFSVTTVDQNDHEGIDTFYNMIVRDMDIGSNSQYRPMRRGVHFLNIGRGHTGIGHYYIADTPANFDLFQNNSRDNWTGRATHNSTTQPQPTTLHETQQDRPVLSPFDGEPIVQQQNIQPVPISVVVPPVQRPAQTSSQPSVNNFLRDCGICLGPVQDATALRDCQHIFCEVCIEGLFDTNHYICPTCRQPFSNRRVYRPQAYQSPSQRSSHHNSRPGSSSSSSRDSRSSRQPYVRPQSRPEPSSNEQQQQPDNNQSSRSHSPSRDGSNESRYRHSEFIQTSSQRMITTRTNNVSNNGDIQSVNLQFDLSTPELASIDLWLTQNDVYIDRQTLVMNQGGVSRIGHIAQNLLTLNAAQLHDEWQVMNTTRRIRNCGRNMHSINPHAPRLSYQFDLTIDEDWKVYYVVFINPSAHGHYYSYKTQNRPAQIEFRQRDNQTEIYNRMTNELERRTSINWSTDRPDQRTYQGANHYFKLTELNRIRVGDYTYCVLIERTRINILQYHTLLQSIRIPVSDEHIQTSTDCYTCQYGQQRTDYYGNVHNCSKVSGSNIPNFVGFYICRKFGYLIKWSNPHYAQWAPLLQTAQRRDIDWHKSYLDQEKYDVNLTMTQNENANIQYWLSQSEDHQLNGRALPVTQSDEIRFFRAQSIALRERSFKMFEMQQKTTDLNYQQARPPRTQLGFKVGYKTKFMFFLVFIYLTFAIYGSNRIIRTIEDLHGAYSYQQRRFERFYQQSAQERPDYTDDQIKDIYGTDNAAEMKKKFKAYMREFHPDKADLDPENYDLQVIITAYNEYTEREQQKKDGTYDHNRHRYKHRTMDDEVWDYIKMQWEILINMFNFMNNTRLQQLTVFLIFIINFAIVSREAWIFMCYDSFGKIRYKIFWLSQIVVFTHAPTWIDYIIRYLAISPFDYLYYQIVFQYLIYFFFNLVVQSILCWRHSWRTDLQKSIFRTLGLFVFSSFPGLLADFIIGLTHIKISKNHEDIMAQTRRLMIQAHGEEVGQREYLKIRAQYFQQVRQRGGRKTNYINRATNYLTGKGSYFDQLQKEKLFIYGQKSFDKLPYVHINRERFNQDVLKPGQSCVKIKQTKWKRTDKLYEQLEQICNCNKKNNWRQTGPNVTVDGIKMESFTFSDCPVNIVYGIQGRHGSVRNTPNPQILNLFRVYARRKIDQILPQVFHNIEQDKTTAEEFLKKFDRQKQDSYIKGYNKAANRGRVSNEYTMNIKNKEINNMDRDCCSPDRCRCIWCQPQDMAFLSGYFNQFLINSIKPVIPGIVHGLNCEGLQNKLNKEVDGKYTQIGADTSGHDSSQFASLIQCCDNYLVNRVFDAIIFRMRCGGLQITPQLAQSLKEQLLSTKINYIIRYKNKIVEKGLVDGTVFSGHATRTTFGNSLRVWLYLNFALEGCGYKYITWVGGDDASIWVDDENIDDAMRRLYERCYTREEGPNQALGQLAKRINISKDSVDFLSKAIVKSIYGFTVGRDPVRALLSGRYTNSQNITDEEHKDARMYSIASWGRKFTLFDQYKPKKAHENLSYDVKMYQNNHPTDVHAMNNYIQTQLGRKSYIQLLNSTVNDLPF